MIRSYVATTSFSTKRWTAQAAAKALGILTGIACEKSQGTDLQPRTEVERATEAAMTAPVTDAIIYTRNIELWIPDPKPRSVVQIQRTPELTAFKLVKLMKKAGVIGVIMNGDQMMWVKDEYHPSRQLHAYRVVCMMTIEDIDTVSAIRASIKGESFPVCSTRERYFKLL